MKSFILLSALAAVALASNYQSADQRPYQSQQSNYQKPAAVPGRVPLGKPVTLPARVPGRQTFGGNGGGISQQQYGSNQQPYNGNTGFNSGRNNNGQLNGAGNNRGSLAKPLYPQQNNGININRPAGGQNRPLVPPNNGHGAFNQQQQQRPGASGTYGAPQKTSNYGGR